MLLLRLICITVLHRIGRIIIRRCYNADDKSEIYSLFTAMICGDKLYSFQKVLSQRKSIEKFYLIAFIVYGTKTGLK
jgi:hypothetical protein